MTKRRRKFTPSLWMDTLRHRRAAKSLRLSAQSFEYREDAVEHSCERPEDRLFSESHVISRPDLDDQNAILPPTSDANEVRGNAVSHPVPSIMIHEEDLFRDSNDIESDLDPDQIHRPENAPEAQDTRDTTSEDSEEEIEEFQPFSEDEHEDEGKATDEINITEDMNITGGPVPSATQEMQGQITDSSDHVDSIPNELENTLQIWTNHLSLTALVAIVGSVRYTVDQYDYTRNMLEDAGANPTWPPYSRTQRYFQKIVGNCFPKSVIINIPTGANSRRSRGGSSELSVLNGTDNAHLDEGSTGRDSGSELSGMEQVRIFLPSSWAKLDLATSVIFDQMFPQFKDENCPLHSLDTSPTVKDRSSITSSCDLFYAKKDHQLVPCRRGSKVLLTIQGSAPSFQTAFQYTSRELHYLLNGFIAATWSVGGEQRITRSGERALKLRTLSTRQLFIISSLSTAEAPEANDEDDSLQVLPGDVCTMLSSSQIDQFDHRTSMFPVVIHRFWKHEDGTPSIHLLWVKYSSRITQNEQSSRQADRRQGFVAIPVQSFVVEDIKAIRVSTASEITSYPEQGDSCSPGSKSHGILMNGLPFLIYRILLYCDDFQRSSAMSPKGSAGGCYFLPLSLPPESRRKTSSVRLISLTPPGISTNHVLHYITDDLVTAATTGVNGFTPTGQKVKIFLDVVGFVGDYPASAAVVDVIGHMCRAPCTVCTFRRLQDANTIGSRFGYATDVHANNSAFMRHGERHRSLRASGMTDEDANKLGMVAAEKYSDTSCPLIHLQQTFESRESSSALRNDGVPVVSNRFDAFRCNLIAPDHLLTGLAIDILNAMFRTLPTCELRIEADIRICDALRKNGLLRQNQVFNLRKKMLNSMTLSELFCVLLVSVPTIKVAIDEHEQEEIIQDCFGLLETLQRLIALTYWWPLPELDGRRAVSLVQDDRERYFMDMKAISKRYVREVDKICSKSDVIKQQLDKPNLHRLIELYEHTVPTMGHVRECMELVFESAHQPLKRCISRSNNHNAHLYAVEHCVGNDWQGRIAALIGQLSDEDDTTSTEARRGLRRVLLGDIADTISEDQDAERLHEIDAKIEKLVTPALKKQFQKDSMISNFSATTLATWRARKKRNNNYISSYLHITLAEANGVVQTSKAWINALYPVIQQTENESHANLFLFEEARYLKLTRSGRQVGKQGRHGILTMNSSVKVYLDPSSIENKIVTSNPSSISARPCFFAILAVLQRGEEIPFAISLRCRRKEDTIQVDPSADISSFQLLRLTQDVRRVATYHDCRKGSGDIQGCTVDKRMRKVSHTKTLVQGGIYIFQTRAQGYPPRIA